MRPARFAAVALVALAACSSDDDDATPTTIETTVAAQSTASLPPVTLVVPSTTDNGAIGPPDQDELDPPTVPVVCTLLSTTEVADALGVEVTGSEEGGTVDDVTPCQFLGPDGDAVLRVIVTGPAHDPPPAELLEERAANAGEVHLLAGDRLLSLVPLIDAAPSDEALTTLADLVLARL